MKNVNKLIVLSVILLLTFNACEDIPPSSDSKGIPSNRGYEVSEGLFVEYYKISGGGVHASDTYAVYLTDTISFCKFLGYMGDSDDILVFPFANGRQVLVSQVSVEMDFGITALLLSKIKGKNLDTRSYYTVRNTNIYEIEALKEEGKWE